MLIAPHYASSSSCHNPHSCRQWAAVLRFKSHWINIAICEHLRYLNLLISLRRQGY
jgi:hypothetical protein